MCVELCMGAYTCVCVYPTVVAGDGKMQIQALTCEMFTQAWCKLWQAGPREWCLRQIRWRERKREREFQMVQLRATVISLKGLHCVSVLIIKILIQWLVWMAWTVDAIKMSSHCWWAWEGGYCCCYACQRIGDSNEHKWFPGVYLSIKPLQSELQVECKWQSPLCCGTAVNSTKSLIYGNASSCQSTGSLHVPRLWHAIQAMGSGICDCRKTWDFTNVSTGTVARLQCLFVK